MKTAADNNIKYSAKGRSFGIVVSNYHGDLTKRLLDGAITAIADCGGDPTNTTIVRVPGTFELPQAAKKLSRQKKLDAIVCLGVVIRGETPHFDYICSAAAHGIEHVAVESDIPISFGVITANTLDEASARAGGAVGNKGQEAAMAAISMANTFSQMTRGA